MAAGYASSSNSMKSADAPARERYELRACERAFTMTDSLCFTTAHVMLVRGQVRELLHHLPAALALTFNRHPKMRAKLVKDEFAVAEIYTHVATRDIATHALLHVRETDAQGLEPPAWHAFVDEQRSAVVNRYERFPFWLHVWVDYASDCARLFLFADHYLSDGTSGYTVLHDLLSFASSLSLASSSSTASTADTSKDSDNHNAALVPSNALPNQPSLHALLLSAHSVVSPILRFVMKFTGKLLFASVPQFVPLLPPRADQHEFTVPPKSNSATMLLADGSQANLAKLLERCRAEQTTFFGAMNAAVFTGYAAAMAAMDDAEDKTFALRMLAAINMRSRVAAPIDSETVGCYAVASPMDKLSALRIDPTATRFWDLARAAKTEVNDIAANFPALALGLIALDQHYTTQANASFFTSNKTMAASSVGDAIVSSIGKYPHATTHTFRCDSLDAVGTLRIDSLHCVARAPIFGPFAQFYITSVDAIGYACSHHYDSVTGAALFATVVKAMEHAGAISSDATLADVLTQIQDDATEAARTPTSKDEGHEQEGARAG